MTQPAEPKPEGNPPQEPPVQQSAGEESAKTFSQAEVNAMMGRTRQEERAKFSDYAHLQERSKVADTLEQAQMTSQQRLESEKSAAQRDAIDARAESADTMIRTSIELKASKLGVADTDAAYRLIDRSGISYNSEDGAVNGVDEALHQLLETRSYLKGRPASAPNINPEGGPPQPVVHLSPEQKTAARVMSMSEEDYAKGMTQQPAS